MLEFFVYDVFTDRAFAGNPLAVVMGADDLDTAQMQVLAGQFNLSETIFVMAPRDAAHAARVRIFLPRAEIPFAGHPTVGCALHLHPGDGALVIQTEAGPVPVTVAGGVAEFAAPVLPQVGGPVDGAAVAAGLGLDPAQVGFDRHRPLIAHAGPAFIYAPLRDLAALAQARPTGAAFDALTRDVAKIYCYTPHGPGFRARMFAPANGVPEDPATGSATATLAAPLLAAGDLAQGTTRLTLHQGVDMGRPSELGLTIEVADGRLSRVRVSGRAVQVAQGRIIVPQM